MIARLASACSRGVIALACAAALCSGALAAAQAKVTDAQPDFPNDPRVGLKAGMYDAGEAAFGMKHLDTLPKPKAFEPAPTPPGQPEPRNAGLNYANSDLAFQGKHMFVGNFYGINVYDISNPAKLSLLTSLICPGGQGDVSVYGHLLFMSVEAANGRLDCGTQGFPLPAGYKPPPPPAPGQPHHRRPPPPPNPERFRGVRIFDISDITRPRQVAAVQTCRGSHTHTLVVDPNDPNNIYVYVSGTSFVRQSAELAGCSGGDPETNPDTSLFSIDVIQVPLAHPEQAHIVSHPRVFENLKTGAVDGLSNGGIHGADLDAAHTAPRKTNECHDITVRSDLGLAAGACSGNGILLNIKDPIHPVRLDAVSDPNYAFWHSASFNNDGTKVVYTDEWGGGTQPRCRATDPHNWGADAIFSLANDKLTLDAYYKMPAAQTETENCVAHNGSLIPIPGRDIEVQAWYQGGISVMDFTDPHHPQEIAFFDRGPIDATKRVIGGFWSAYWYNGNIYGSEIARGVDTFSLVPDKYLTQNEIDAAKQVQVAQLNVQNQQKFVWPQNFVTARAYVDQLKRDNALPAAELTKLSAALKKDHPGRRAKRRLKTIATSLEQEASSAKTPWDAKRMHALAAILNNPQV